MAPPIHPLTSLRFFAALGITVFHLQSSFGYNFSNINFGVAIIFFFVLSGFILTYVYEGFDQPGSVFRFYVSRFARIWPLHLITWLYFLVYIHAPDPGLSALNLLLLQSWSAEYLTAMSMNGVAWSISVEMFFYLMFPLVILTRRYLAFWFLAALAAVALGVLGALHMGEVGQSMEGVHWMTYLHVGPPARFLEFLSGVGTALLFRRLQGIRLSFTQWTLLECAAIALLLFVAQLQPLHGLYFNNFTASLAIWFLYSGSFPWMCMVVLCFAFQGGAWSRLLSVRPLVFLGEVSFTIYMVHQLVQTTWTVQGLAPTEWDPFLYAVILAQILVISILCYVMFEKPARELIVGCLSRRKPLTLSEVRGAT